MSKFRKLFLIIPLIFIFFIATLQFLPTTQATDFTVTNSNDSGAGSLRLAIENANQNGQSDTITFDSSLNGQTITLLSGSLYISSPLTIDASALTDSIRISGNDSSRVFYIGGGGIVTMTNLIIANGVTPIGDGACTTLCGGGIFVESEAQLTLENSLVTNNFANSGGGILNSGSILIKNSQLISNTANFDGGAIRTAGDLIIRNSAIMSNTSNNVGGGAIYAEIPQTLQLISSTLAYNTANGNGGAIFVTSQFFLLNNLEISNSTLSNNQATGNGGALYATAEFTVATTLSLANSTLSGNSSGVHLFADATSSISATVHNTIIANSAGPNCTNISGNIHNLSDDDSCQGFRQGNPRLASLADNGGPTLTQLPLVGSAAMGRGDPTICQAAPINGFDQRGVARLSAKCDIGAAEVEDSLIIFLPLIIKN